MTRSEVLTVLSTLTDEQLNYALAAARQPARTGYVMTFVHTGDDLYWEFALIRALGIRWHNGRTQWLRSVREGVMIYRSCIPMQLELT
jgi:hypothetical protein